MLTVSQSPAAVSRQVQLQTFATAYVLRRYSAALGRLRSSSTWTQSKNGIPALHLAEKAEGPRQSARTRSRSRPIAALNVDGVQSDAIAALNVDGVRSDAIAALNVDGVRSDVIAALNVDGVRSGAPPDQLAEQDFGNAGVSDKSLTGESKLAELGIPAEARRLLKMSRRRGEQKWYLLAAIASTTGFTTLAAAAVVYRFVWQMPLTGEIPYTEIMGTFLLAVGAAVGMEYWARWAHKALWHASLWNMHESHHRPRDGPFETNDIFAIINAIPAIALMLFGFLNRGLVPGLCFGAGLGITMFGISYMFVHDGLVHRRFPVGPIADVPYLKRVAAAHQLHHADLFQGVPYGLFLGPMEIEEVGGKDELDKLLLKRAAAKAQLRKSTLVE